MSTLQFIGDLHPIIEFLPDGRDVHGDADDFLVSRELFGVDRRQEGPGVLVAAELWEDGLTDGDVLVNLGAPRPLLLPDLHLLRHALLLLRGGGVLYAGVGRRLSTLPSSVLVKIWLGLLNFFLGAFPLQPGQRHFPRGVWEIN